MPRLACTASASAARNASLEFFRIAKHQAHYLPTRLAKHTGSASLLALLARFSNCQTLHNWQVPSDYVLEPPLNLDAVGDLQTKRGCWDALKRGTVARHRLPSAPTPLAGNALLREASFLSNPRGKKGSALHLLVVVT